MNKISNIKEKIQENKTATIILVIIISIIIMITYFSYKIRINNMLEYQKILTYIIMLILIIIIFITFLYIYKKKNLKPEKAFLIIGTLFCVLFSIFMPMTKGHDESIHAIRIYEYSEGIMVNNGKNVLLPQGAINAMEDKPHYEDILNNSETYDIKTPYKQYGYRMSTYSPITYAPQILGVLTGKIITNNAMIHLYLARLFNMITCIMMIYFAIKIIPFGKNIIFLIASIPIAVEGYVTLSADGILLATSILFISYILKIIYNSNEKIGAKQIAILSFLSIIIAISKTIYFPLIILLFLIPKDRFKNNKSKILQIISIFTIATILDLLWCRFGTKTDMLDVDNEAIKYILINPIQYIQLVLYTLITKFPVYINEMFGGALEWNENVKIAIFPYILLITIFLISIKGRKEYFNISLKSKILVIGIILSIILLVFTSMFVGWSRIDINYIEGVQGRYFLPLLPLIIFIIGRKLFDDENTTKNISVLILLLQFFVITNIFMFHV